MTAPCDNDCFSEFFVSKTDPLFLTKCDESNKVDEAERRAALRALERKKRFQMHNGKNNYE